MGAACSRISTWNRRKKKDDYYSRELYNNNIVPHPPWPSPPPNGLTTPTAADLLEEEEEKEKQEQEKLSLRASQNRPSEAMEKGRHEAPPAEKIASHFPLEGSNAEDHRAESPQAESENKDEKRRLSRILSGRASTVRNMTSSVAKKGASKVLGKAVEAIDNIGSSVGGLGKGATTFAAGVVPSKGHRVLAILAFEVANTIVKASNLKLSLSEEEMHVLREETLASEAVQLLVSTDYDELMSIAASDKRHELKIFTDEVVRFGNHCRDPQWHNLDRVFDRLIKEGALPHQTKEEANRVMDDLMVLAQNTAELYHELHALDRFKIDLKRKQQEEDFFSRTANSRGSIPEETVALLKSEVKSQERHVKTLKKKSLWAKVLEEVMEQLVDIVYYLYQEIHDNFGPDVFLEEVEKGYMRNTGKLGTSGLALHYANIINQIDTLVSRPSSVPANARDNLYQGLPPTMKTTLRVRLHQSSNKDALTMDELRSELYKILDWMVPVATNTTKAHHGFGWVGEWANSGSSTDRKAMGYTEMTLLQTLHHANQQKVEAVILELIVGLHYLVSKARKNKLNNNSNNSNNSNNNNNNNNTNSNPNSNSNTNRLQHQFPPKFAMVTRKPTQPFVPPERNISPPPLEMFKEDMFDNRLRTAWSSEPTGIAGHGPLSQERVDEARLRISGSSEPTGIDGPGSLHQEDVDEARMRTAGSAEPTGIGGPGPLYHGDVDESRLRTAGSAEPTGTAGPGPLNHGDVDEARLRTAGSLDTAGIGDAPPLPTSPVPSDLEDRRLRASHDTEPLAMRHVALEAMPARRALPGLSKSQEFGAKDENVLVGLKRSRSHSPCG